MRITLVGTFEDDDIMATYDANFSDASIGANKTINVANITLTGKDSTNYTLSENTATATASITSLKAQTLYEVGDAGMAFDMSKYDTNYPYMLDWMTAGVVGGIPTTDDWANKIVTLSTSVLSRPTTGVIDRSTNVANSTNQAEIGAQAAAALANAPNTADIQAKVDEVAAAGGGIVILENGYYYLDTPLYMPSNVILRGREEGKVTLFIGSTDAIHANIGAITFATMTTTGELVGSKNSGLEDIILEGVLGKPKEDWNVTAATELDSDSNFILFDTTTESCWTDDVSVINSYQMPVNVAGKQNTIRDTYINGAFCRGGGAQGYFLVSGHHNLVTGCLITHLRHFSLQAETCAYNVVYDNELRQEFSFHVRDYGRNLIENNTFVLPGANDPIEISGKYSLLGYPEYYDYPMPTGASNVFSLDGIPSNYYSIMGPWSVQHDKSAVPNLIYNNYIMEYNHVADEFIKDAEASADAPALKLGEVKGYENTLVPAPWSEPGVLYTGPYYIKPSDPWINFPQGKDGYSTPIGGTLYPVVLDGSISTETATEIILPDVINIYTNDTEQVELIILPEHLNDMDVVWSVDKMSVATVDQNGVVTGVAVGETTLNVVSVDGKTSANAKIIVHYKPIDLRVENTFVESFKTLPLNPTTGNNSTITNYYWLAPNGIAWGISGNGNKQMMLHQKTGEIYTDYLATGINSFSVDFIKFAADAGGTIELSVQLIAEDGSILYETSSGLVDATSTETLSVDNLNINQPVRIRLYDENQNSKTKLMIQSFTWTSFAHGENAVNVTDIQAPAIYEIAKPSTTAFEIPLTFTPTNSTMQNVTYTSSDSSVIEVTTKGLVAKADGSAIITITNLQNKNIVASTLVVVGAGAESEDSNDAIQGTTWKETFNDISKFSDINEGVYTGSYDGTLDWNFTGRVDYEKSPNNLIVYIGATAGTLSTLYPAELGDLASMTFNVKARWFLTPTFAPTLTFKDPETLEVIKTIKIPEINLSNTSYKLVTVDDIDVKAPFILEISNVDIPENYNDKLPPHIFRLSDIEFTSVAPRQYFEPSISNGDLNLQTGDIEILATKDFDTSQTSLVWKSSNDSVASVSEKGHLFANAVCSTTISATGKDYNGAEKTVSINVTVTQGAEQGDIFYPAFITINDIQSTASAKIGANATATVTAHVTDAKTLTYQWYAVSDLAKSNPVAINGATSATYTFTQNAQGTYHYYCEVSAEHAIAKETSVASVVFTGTAVPNPPDAGSSGSGSSGTTTPPATTPTPDTTGTGGTTDDETQPTPTPTDDDSSTTQPSQPDPLPQPETDVEIDEEEVPQTSGEHIEQTSNNLNPLLIIGVVVAIIALAAGAVFVFRRNSTSSED